MAIWYQSLLENTNTVLNQAVVWIKQITISCTHKYLPELIKFPCQHSQNRLWRKREKLKEVLGERAKLGLDFPLWPFWHPCLWWTELPLHWRPGYDLAFLKILLELLNNQFKNKRAFLHLGLRGFFLYNLARWLTPTLVPENAEIKGKDFDFTWPLPCQYPGQKLVSQQHLPVTLWCFSDPCLLPHCCRSQSITIRLHAVGHKSCRNQQHITFKNKHPRLRWHLSELHIMMELYGLKTEGQREVMLLDKRSCPHWL